MLAKIQDFDDFQDFKWFFLSEFGWIRFNLQRSASIYNHLPRSEPWNFMDFSEISRKLRISWCYLKFHMGQVKNWPLRRPWNSGSLGNFWKFFIEFSMINMQNKSLNFMHFVENFWGWMLWSVVVSRIKRQHKGLHKGVKMEVPTI